MMNRVEMRLNAMVERPALLENGRLLRSGIKLDHSNRTGWISAMNRSLPLGKYLLCAFIFIVVFTLHIVPGTAAEPTVPDAPAQASATLQLSELKPGQTFRECPDCPEMVVIPAGEFEMGVSDDEIKQGNVPWIMARTEQPQHHVSIKSFAIGKYPITKEQFSVEVAETVDDAKGCKTRVPNTYQYFPDKNWRDPGFQQTDRDPVVCVSWYDALHYVSWLNGKVAGRVLTPSATNGPYRLITEAEMEYATRGGTTTAWFWGNDVSHQCEFANGADLTAADHFPDFGPPLGSCRDGYSETSPVGSFKPNPWGLYDMVGNVGQWTADCWNEDHYVGAPEDGTANLSYYRGWLSVLLRADCEKRTVRGASWAGPPASLRSAARTYTNARLRESVSGFRVARAIP
jgi:formylglycine-generating enzyme required for sulfatase activity